MSLFERVRLAVAALLALYAFAWAVWHLVLWCARTGRLDQIKKWSEEGF